MRIINKIYIWFRKVILNILGVIRDMINKNNEYEVEILKTKCEIAKYIINKSTDGIKYIFGSGNNLIEIGIFGICACIGLTLAGYHKQTINEPDDKGASDDEN